MQELRIQEEVGPARHATPRTQASREKEASPII